MSYQKEAYGRSRVGAHGDRRQQPALRKTLTGINSKMNLLRKRSSTNVDVDEEEWNQRMQTWEKKRQRLSGSDWDRSFREAVHNRLKGKKPWRTPISKTPLRKVDRKSNLSENENNCQSNTTAILQSDSEKFANGDTYFKQKQENPNNEDGKMGKMPLEIAGLKRETSKMELGVTYLAHSDSFHQNVKTWKEQNFAKSLKSNILKANIKFSDTAEKPDDIIWTKGLTFADTNNLAQSSTMFIKTVLSPIQSESECSKVDAEVQSCDGQNTIDESNQLMKEKSTGNESLRLPEIRMEMSAVNKERNTRSDEPIHKKQMKMELCLSSEQSLAGKRQTDKINNEPITNKESKPVTNEESKPITHKESKTEQSMPYEQLLSKNIPIETNSSDQIHKKKSKAEKGYPTERPLVKNSPEVKMEHEVKMDHSTSRLFQNNEQLLTNQESQRLPEEEELSGLKNNEETPNFSSQKTNSSFQISSRLRINDDIQTTDKGEANEDEKKSSQQQHRKTKDWKKHTDKKKRPRNNSKKDNTVFRKMCSSEIQLKTIDEVSADGTEDHHGGKSSEDSKLQRKNKCSNSPADRKVCNVNERAKLQKYYRSHEALVDDAVYRSSPKICEHDILVTGNTLHDKISKHSSQEWHGLSSLSKNYSSVSNKNGEDDRKPRETLYDSSSLTCASKGRTLHAIFSSPDTEIFGSRKKPPAQPVFIRTEFTEYNVPFEQMDAAECISKEPYELRAQPRPMSDESLLLDESSETLSSSPGMWYREFHHPVVSSEEFESDQMKSDCYREIIIDRSRCRSSYDGPCHARMSDGYGSCCVRRYEVCHDTSKCALKNTKKKNHQVQSGDIKIIREASSSVDSWYYTD